MFVHVKRLFLISVISLVFIPSTVLGEDWPGNPKGYGAPYTAYYMGKTCGDFIRAYQKYLADDKYSYYIYFSWTLGWISGLNESLPRGGNILGKGNPKVADFLILVETYCRENPTDKFINGLSLSLRDMTPVDWNDKEYTDKEISVPLLIERKKKD